MKIHNQEELNAYDKINELQLGEDIKDQNYSIARFIVNHNQIITTFDNEQVFFYKNGYYQQEAESRIKDQIQEILKGNTTTHRVSEIINHVKRMSYKEREVFEKTDLNLINLKNGVYNIQTEELIPHSPDYYFISQIQTNYNKDAWVSTELLKFFSEIVIEKELKILTEFIAYCLYRNNPHKKAFMLNGGGDNGKTTFLTIVMALLGKDNYSSVELQDLDENRFSKIDLYGKHANLVDDLPAKVLKHTGAFKSITGNGEISAEMKYGGRFNYKPYAKLCFATNSVPRTNDDSDAFHNRWVIITFPNSFTGENADRKLGEKLTTEQETEGLLMYCLSILPKLINQGFSDCETIEEKRLKYNRLSDSVGCFLVDFVEKDSIHATPKEDLYNEFIEYCKTNNFSVITEKTFSRALYTIYPKIEEGRLKQPATEIRKRCWVGLRFTGENTISFGLEGGR